MTLRQLDISSAFAGWLRGALLTRQKGLRLTHMIHQRV